MKRLFGTEKNHNILSLLKGDGQTLRNSGYFFLRQHFAKYLLVVLILGAFSPSKAFSAETIAYQDKLGRTVSLRIPVQRAVVFQLYEFLPALQCWDKVAGVGRYAYDNDLIRAAKPDIQSIPSAGSGTDINIEALLKLKPEVVITWTFKPENVTFMEQRGLKVISVYPDALAELYSLIKLQGQLFAREKQAQNAISEMESLFNLIRSRAARIPAPQRKKILYIGSRPNTVSGASGLTNGMIDLLGGLNVAGGIKQRNADVSIETIIGWNPDIIFIWGNAKYNAIDILSNPQWRFIKAVREGRVYKAPEWSTWSPRLAPIVLWMAARAYPALYQDIDLHAATDKFYRKVFGIPLGKADADGF